jgi:anaerobic nitric oxide reductase transcription regulator
MSYDDVILDIALDLNRSLTSKDRWQRLLLSIKTIIPYDAASLMRLNGDHLIPMATIGIDEKKLPSKFVLKDHPKLEIACKSKKATIFPHEMDLPDPFDDLLDDVEGPLSKIHACLGMPLILKGKVIGLLTADAIRSDAFDKLDFKSLEILAALAASSSRISTLISRLEDQAKSNQLVASDLIREKNISNPTFVGDSNTISKLKEEIELVAKSSYTVLITGETGSGKEIAANAVHKLSNRNNKALIYVNCAALPESLAESELFGHKRGSFTGAISDRAGKFEIANKGTIFLDEIGELPLSIQAKLLRVLQTGEIQRVGEDKTVRVDVRVIAATNRELEKEIEKRKFRLDLYHRLNVFPISIPPLRDHKEDIPLIIGSFCDRIKRKLGTGTIRVHPSAIDRLKQQNFPGNVRELRNIMERAALTASTRQEPDDTIMITSDDLTLLNSKRTEATPTLTSTGDTYNLKEATKEFQKTKIKETVKITKGNWSKAAQMLGIHKSNLSNLAKKYNLR